jgi:hypothetical protein
MTAIVALFSEEATRAITMRGLQEHVGYEALFWHDREANTGCGVFAVVLNNPEPWFRF